jgi:hypothetical protein
MQSPHDMGFEWSFSYKGAPLCCSSVGGEGRTSQIGLVTLPCQDAGNPLVRLAGWIGAHGGVTEAW